MSSQPSTSSPSPSSPAGSDDAGPAGLGKMSSLSAECTPLKHAYDSCFNRWFEHYLAVTSPSPRAEGSAPAPEPSAAPVSSRTSSLWGRSQPAQGAGAGDDAQGEKEREKRTRLRAELDDKCGAFFGEYQGCVKRALKDRQLLPLLSTARELNPFPFPPVVDAETRPNGTQGSHSPSSSPNPEDPNFPFPFSAASRQERAAWERSEAWGA